MSLSHYTSAKAATTKWMMPYVSSRDNTLDCTYPGKDSWIQTVLVYAEDFMKDLYNYTITLCTLEYDIENKTYCFNILQGIEYLGPYVSTDKESSKRSFSFMEEVPFEYQHISKFLLIAHKEKDWPEPVFSRIH